MEFSIIIILSENYRYHSICKVSNILMKYNEKTVLQIVKLSCQI